MIFLVQKLIRPFSLYVLFSQCRSCDNNLEDCVFQIFPHSRAYVSIIMKKTKGEIPPELHWGKKRISREKKCESLNRVSSGKEKNSSDQLSTKSAHPASKKLSVARLVLYKETQCTPIVACHVYLSRLFSHLVPKHWCMGTGIGTQKYFVVTAWLGTRYVTVCTFALFCLF